MFNRFGASGRGRRVESYRNIGSSKTEIFLKIFLLRGAVISELFVYLQNVTEESNGGDKKFVACVSSASPRGHTGYLTTATYLKGNQQAVAAAAAANCENCELDDGEDRTINIDRNITI